MIPSDLVPPHDGLTIMAWDTATAWCTVVLERFNSDGSSTNLGVFSSGEGTASKILPLEVERLFKEAGLKPTDLDLLAVGRGPGSFTGLRVGLALAKGLAYGAGVELIGLSTLEVVAASILKYSIPPNETWEGTLVAPLIDARHGQIFTALYRVEGSGAFAPLLVPQPMEAHELPNYLLKIADGENILVGGPAVAILQEAYPDGGPSLVVVPEATAPEPGALARLARQLHQCGVNYLEANPPNPMYIRQPQIW